MIGFVLRGFTLSLIGIVMAVGLALGIGRVLPPEEEFLFTSTFDGKDLEIYRMSVPRSLIVPVTRNVYDEFQAGWSPDGEQIVFVSNRGGTSAIHLMDAQGYGVKRLTEGQIGDYSPVWSPDGQWIALITDRYPQSRELMLMEAATGQMRRLTNDENLDNNPTWSPDSQQLVFNSAQRAGNLNNLFTLDIEDGAIMPLVATANDEFYPVWSPDGRYIVYLKGVQQSDLYLWDNEQKVSMLLYSVADIIPNTLGWSADSRFVTYSTSFAFGSQIHTLDRLDVAACIQSRESCQAQALITMNGFFTNIRWRPTPP